MQSYDKEFDLSKMQWLLERIEPDQTKQEIICEQIRKGVNTVKTSSLGRVFDAVAAMLGLGSYNHFEAQLPMALESIADANCEEKYNFELTGQMSLDLRPMIRQIVTDISQDKNRATISAKYHNTIAAGLLEMAKSARQSKNLNTVALSGGVFCNRFLVERLTGLLNKNGFKVLCNIDFPANDGCISVGQAAIAARSAIRYQ
jgi:hydrogenase maturation protein HypF